VLTESRKKEILEWAEQDDPGPSPSEVGEILDRLEVAEAVADAATELLREHQIQADLGRPTLACGLAREELVKALGEYGTEAPCR
jgi:hypothetical protein